MAVRRPFTREQRTTILYGMLAFVLILVVLQLWLLTATMNAYLGGDDRLVTAKVRVHRRGEQPQLKDHQDEDEAEDSIDDGSPLLAGERPLEAHGYTVLHSTPVA